MVFKIKHQLQTTRVCLIMLGVAFPAGNSQDLGPCQVKLPTGSMAKAETKKPV